MCRMPAILPETTDVARRAGYRGGMVRLVGGLLGLLVLAGCASAADREEETGPSPTPSVTSAPSTSAPASGESPPLQPQSSEPLVLAVHPRRPPANLTRAQAGLLLDGGVTRWQQLGLPGGRLTVTHDRHVLSTLPRDTVAVVPASAVGPGVQVLSVEGIDPMRRPDAYPLRAAGPAPGRVTTLTVVGDMMLGRRVATRAAAAGDPSYPLRPMARRLAAADITVGNLESTLSTEGRPRQGDDSFAADPRVRVGLRAAGFDAVGLANNHTGDYGDRALVRTVSLLRQGGLRPFGV